MARGLVRRKVWTMLCLAAAGASLNAGTNTTYTFLRSDVSARAAALAGSFVSVTNDPNMLFYNVAGLGTLDVPRGSVGFFKHLLDINSGYVSYSQALEDIGHVGAGIIYTNYGSFTETDEAGNDLGSFSASDLSFAVGYSNEIEKNLTYGASVKFIYSSIAGVSSSAIAADAGILYLIPDSRISLGASIRNLGTQLSRYLGTHEDLPLDVTIGGSIVPRGLPLLLSVNLHRLNDDVPSFIDKFKGFSVGGEFTLSKVVQLRFGYDNARRKDLKLGTSAGLAGFSAGFGINTGDYRIDYAISSLGKIGNFHRISVGSTF